MDVKLFSVIGGTVVPIEKVEDAAFAQKILGDGLAVKPELKVQTVVAPCDGVVTTVGGTGHAVALLAGDTEILIHIGIDTVMLKGEGFKPLVKADEKVKKGQKLIEVDFPLVAKKAPSIDVITVITNLNDSTLKKTDKSTVAEGDLLFTIV